MRKIYCSQLTHQFGSLKALNQVSIEVGRGEIVGLLGANGAGKTTLIKILCGLLKPTSGEAEVAGIKLYRDSKKVRKKIGYMGQHSTLFDDLTLRENIEFYAAIYGLTRRETHNKIEHLKRVFDIDRFADNLAGELPSGWRQILAFTTTQLHHPEVLFLDEPTAGLDAVTRRELWNLISLEAESGTTVLVSTHYLDEAYYCNKLVILEEGEVKTSGDRNRVIEAGGSRGLTGYFS